MNQSDSHPPSAETTARTDAVPRYRPEERFWPYVELSEQPGAEELAALNPDLHDALYGPGNRPFSFTIVFPRFAGPQFDQALALAREATEFREVGEGDAYRVRARFLPSEPLKLRQLFELVSDTAGCEVLIDDRPVPYARELWLPLVWFLIPR
jgi:hypothetical protein